MTGNLAGEIVLLPGLDGSGELFERVAQLLSPHLAVTVVRYPQDPGMTYPDYARLVADRIGERPVLLLGESFSGPIAVLTAAAPGASVRGVVLAATFLKSPWPGWLVRQVRRVPPLASRPLLNWILMGTRIDPELSGKMKDVISRLSPEVRAARLDAVSRVDVRRVFHDGRYPVLVLYGRRDWLVPGSSVKSAAAKRASTCEVQGLDTEHLLLQTAADEAASHILAFAKKLMTDSSGGANAP